MGYEKDIGKFATLSYKKQDGKYLVVYGKLDIDENGILLFINVNDPTATPKKVNPNEVTIVDYSAEPIRVKQ